MPKHALAVEASGGRHCLASPGPGGRHAFLHNLPFLDIFSRPDGPAGYDSVGDGVLTIASGIATGRSSDGRGFGVFHFPHTDLDVTATANTGTFGNITVYCRYEDDQNYVRVDWNQSAFAIYEKYHGSFTNLTGVDFSSHYATSSTAQTARLQVAGTTVKFYANGTLRSTRTLTTALTGTGAGCGTDGPVHFTSLTVA